MIYSTKTDSLSSHLISRGIIPGWHRYYINEEDNVVTFPFWNLSGQMIGYQRYQPGKSKTKIPDAEKRYYTYSIPDSYPVWGVESLAWPGPIFMLEGIFDACRLHHFFLPALAIFGNDSKHLVPWFKAMNREVIAICDNDDDFAGLKLSKASTRSICLIKWKDLGEMNCDEISNLLKYFM